MTTTKIIFWMLICQLAFLVNSCQTNTTLDNFYQHLGDTKNVQRLSPSHVLVLAIAANDINVSDLVNEEIKSLKEKGIDLENKVIFYDMRNKVIDSLETSMLESFLDRDVASFRIINPKASLCHFFESKASMEALIF